MSEKPRFTNSCPDCDFLGLTDHGDAYWCRRENMIYRQVQDFSLRFAWIGKHGGFTPNVFHLRSIREDASIMRIIMEAYHRGYVTKMDIDRCVTGVNIDE